KLLARTAHTKAKNLSLITSDSRLVAMAGAAKIATAPNLSAEPSILKSGLSTGAAVGATGSAIKINNPEDDLDSDSPQQAEDLDEDLTIDDSDLTQASAVPVAIADEGSGKVMKPKDPKDKKVPNFYDFRKKALIGLGVFFGLLIIVLLLMTSKKSAAINVRANAERLDVNFSAKLNESATETTKDELKAVKKSGSKSTTETTPATGEQDIGAKASGKVTLYNCDKNDNDITLSSGTGVSSGGLTFLTTSSVKVPVSNFTGGGTCKKDKSATVNVIAQNSGSQYNVGARSYSVSGASSVTGQGSEMTGGTTQIVKVVSQNDVNSLKEKLATNNQEAYKAELRSQFNSSQKALEETFSVQLGEVQVTPAVGQQAETVTATVVANYSMYGAEENQLQKILELNINEAKKDQSQSIVKNGLEDLIVTSGENGNFSFSTVSYIGPNIDLDKIKQDSSGKKKGEAIQLVKSFEGVDDASVKISPFWSSTLPGSDKIEIKIEIANSNNN
ncbi:MAG TPA: hypothetical protein P5247_02420, partial [Candidatus Saccharimonadales bacterium]|nr:hypothetical protein [Candidatus Saccharimonadales bacterium]